MKAGIRNRFKICVRAKRGLEDTSQHGGWYKDKAYFEGAVKILQKRSELDFKLLFSAKIAMEDITKAEVKEQMTTEGIKQPYFVQDMEKYLAALDRIASTNFIE